MSAVRSIARALFAGEQSVEITAFAAALRSRCETDLDTAALEAVVARQWVETARRALRSNGDGPLPYAMSVGRGVYKQPALFDLTEYEVAIDRYRRQGDVSREKAEALIALCSARLGVQLSMDVS